MARCYKRAKKSQKSYWGKGVTVCDEWHKYVNFKCWALDNGYEIGLSIDRVDLDGNYCPENCRWITISENSTATASAQKLFDSQAEVITGTIL